jgi:hypothetical protein
LNGNTKHNFFVQRFEKQVFTIVLRGSKFRGDGVFI